MAGGIGGVGCGEGAGGCEGGADAGEVWHLLYYIIWHTFLCQNGHFKLFSMPTMGAKGGKIVCFTIVVTKGQNYHFDVIMTSYFQMTSFDNSKMVPLGSLMTSPNNSRDSKCKQPPSPPYTRPIWYYGGADAHSLLRCIQSYDLAERTKPFCP